MKLHCFSNTLVAQSPVIIHDYKQFAPVVFFLAPSKRTFVPLNKFNKYNHYGSGYDTKAALKELRCYFPHMMTMFDIQDPRTFA